MEIIARARARGARPVRRHGRLRRPRWRDGHVHHDPHGRASPTGAPTCSPARASSPTPIPRREYEECMHKARALHKALELAAGMNAEEEVAPDDPRHRQLRQLHLQPRAAARGARRRGRGAPQRRAHRRGGARARARGHRRLAGSGHARRRRHLAATSSAPPPRPACRCSACVSATSASPRCTAATICRAPQAGARQDRRDHPRRRGPVRRHPEPVHGDALPLAVRRRRQRARRRSRSQATHARRRHHGRCATASCPSSACSSTPRAC